MNDLAAVLLAALFGFVGFVLPIDGDPPTITTNTTTTVALAATGVEVEYVDSVFAREREYDLSAEIMAEVPCRRWEYYTVSQLREMVVAAGPGWHWLKKDPDKDGYPCEDYIGEDYRPAEWKPRL